MKSFLLGAALSLACLGANAGVISFDGHSNTIFGDDDASNGVATVSLDGFIFSNAADHFHLADLAQFGAATNGTSSLLSDREGILTLARNGGGSFDITSLLGYSYFSSTLSITGYFAAGGQISVIVAVNPDTLSSIALDGFTGLTSVAFEGSPTTLMAPAGFGIDSVMVDYAGAPVPEPFTPALVALALAAVGLGRRNKFKAAH